jgi:hypothetical protein
MIFSLKVLKYQPGQKGRGHMILPNKQNKCK